ncbi:unnamed protein product, partial [Rotaria socialis]
VTNGTTVAITVTGETSRLTAVSAETTEAETSTVTNGTTVAIAVSTVLARTTEAETSTVRNGTTVAIAVSTASTNIPVATTISYTSTATPTASTSTAAPTASTSTATRTASTSTATPTASTSTILTTTSYEKPPETNNNNDLQQENLRLKLGLGTGLGLGVLATTSLAVGLYIHYNRGVSGEQKNNIGKNNNSQISPKNPPVFPSPVPSSLSAISFISIDELTKLEKSDPVQSAPIVPCIITDQTSSRSDETFIEVYIEEDQVIPIDDIDGETHRILNSMASNVNDHMKSDFGKKRYRRMNSKSPTIQSTTPASTKRKLFNSKLSNYLIISYNHILSKALAHGFTFSGFKNILHY